MLVEYQRETLVEMTGAFQTMEENVVYLTWMKTLLVSLIHFLSGARQTLGFLVAKGKRCSFVMLPVYWD
jgi:hypothetical protein